MKINQNTVIKGTRLSLIPYHKEHVAQYHEWMKNPELQELTASEPLSLEEEYDMQRKWAEDENKVTFIIVSKDFMSSSTNGNTRFGGMVGDVNIFYNEVENSKETGEIEVMIAESSMRRKGLGKEALQMMMVYTNKYMKTKRFVAKILEENKASIQMFEKLGFQVFQHVPVFSQVNLVLDLSTANKPEWINELTLKMMKYE